ncbi:MAG: HNH endonuclease [Armatimonadota bacterium]
MNLDKREAWTREELVLAVNLYCKTPFGKIHIRNPEIISLASKLGRTPGSISYKLANFASIDPSLDRKGASNVSKLDIIVWNEFHDNWDDMVYESEKLVADIQETIIDEIDEDILSLPEGKMRESMVKIRINQRFFRQMILASYNETCCITGMSVTELLVASHIIPWALDSENRMNPRNGLCLNALHDKAFDAGLITINESFQVIVSQLVHEMPYEKTKLIADYDKQLLTMPSRFIPDQAYLDFHRTNIFLG